MRTELLTGNSKRSEKFQMQTEGWQSACAGMILAGHDAAQRQDWTQRDRALDNAFLFMRERHWTQREAVDEIDAMVSEAEIAGSKEKSVTA